MKISVPPKYKKKKLSQMTEKTICHHHHHFMHCQWIEMYLGFLLVEVVDDDADEEVQGEEGAKDDKTDEVQVHVKVVLIHRLVLHLHNTNNVEQRPVGPA